MSVIKRRVKIGVVGTGWWATYAHIPALLARSEVELVALCDRSLEKVRRAAEVYKVPRFYTDWRKMFESEAMDGVVVATSHVAHYEVAKAALENKWHVLLEKPMVLKTSEASELVELANRNGLQIVMSTPWNYTSHVRRGREVILSGELGEVQLVSSLFASSAYETYRGNLDAYSGVMEAPLFRPGADENSDPDRGGGQGYCQVSHSATLAFWVTGLSAQEVSAHMNYFDVKVDVADSVNLRLDNGAVGVLASTGNLHPGDPDQHTLSVYCSRGYLILDMGAGTLMIRKHDGTVECPPPLKAEERYPRFAPADHFVGLILGISENLSPGELGQETVNFLDAVYKSAANGGASVSVEPTSHASGRPGPTNNNHIDESVTGGAWRRKAA